MTPLEEIAAERERQKAVEGWTAEHDDRHANGAMGDAAACYAMTDEGRVTVEVVWPWSWTWWKPKDRRRDLVRAGALIVAELERLDRAKVRPAEHE